MTEAELRGIMPKADDDPRALIAFATRATLSALAAGLGARRCRLSADSRRECLLGWFTLAALQFASDIFWMAYYMQAYRRSAL